MSLDDLRRKKRDLDRMLREAERLSGGGGQYAAHRRRMAEHQAASSRAGRELPPIKPPEDPARYGAARESFRVFCESYLPEKFSLAWGDDHLLAIARIEDAVLRGGLFAVAMPRGSGKTTLVEAAVIWSLVYGHRPFVVLVGADESHAVEMLANVKMELEQSDRLLADFGAVCQPIRAIEGIANRCKGQLYQGRRTHVRWSDREVVLPTIPGSPASGCRVKARGLGARIRGMKATTAGGLSIRPSLAIIDDPQTDESAASPQQCAKRIAVLMGGILGLAGPGVKMAAVMPCTVIHHGDMADQILDREKCPQWQGLRTRLLDALPSDAKLWERYAELRAAGLRDGTGLAAATAFYRDHQAAMDEGARPTWPVRFNPDELSAIQHAMNLKLQDPVAFAAEYQNEPLAAAESHASEIPAEAWAGKRNGLSRAQVPAKAVHLTAFIDVHDRVLFWAVCAWETDFTGYLIDYNSYPPQPAAYWTLKDARATLPRKFPGRGREAAVSAGLQACATELLGRAWTRDDGTYLQVGKLLIDCGYLPDVVDSVIRLIAQGDRAMPSRGVAIRATEKDFAEYQDRPGEIPGWHWRIMTRAANRRTARHVRMDVNFWKTFLATRVLTALDDRGSLSVFGRADTSHRLLADHAAAEYGVENTARGRTVIEWRLRPARDNHWLDCLVGCTAAASMLGVATPGAETAPRARKRIRLSDLQRSKHP